MKRRLPTIRKGEVVVAAISLPPLTGDANRHRPTTRHPGKPAAASNAAPIAVRAKRPASAGGQIASPPRSTASAANATPSSPARAPNRRTQPRAVVCGTPARAAAGRTPHPPRPPARSPRRPPRRGPAARPARTRAAAHGSPGTGRTAPWARRSSGTGPPPGHAASNQTRTPAARRTTGRPDGEPPPRGQPPHTHRPAAGTAIRWPRATHRLGSLPAIGRKRGEEGSRTFRRDRKILARTAATRRRHRQTARPDTRPRCSGNQAVNSWRGCRGCGGRARVSPAGSSGACRFRGRWPRRACRARSVGGAGGGWRAGRWLTGGAAMVHRSPRTRRRRRRGMTPVSTRYQADRPPRNLTREPSRGPSSGSTGRSQACPIGGKPTGPRPLSNSCTLSAVAPHSGPREERHRTRLRSPADAGKADIACRSGRGPIA
jgi:hypothetical protein